MIVSTKEVVFAACTLLAASAWAADKEVLGPDKWPTSVAETVKDILRTMPGKDKETLRATKKEDLIRFHHGWGTGIRNHYGLWRGNDKLLLSACGGALCHPDDASMAIIEAVWTALQPVILRKEAASPRPKPGGDRDVHGCIASAGYHWCARTSQCERPWELARKRSIESSRQAFDAFCGGR